MRSMSSPGKSQGIEQRSSLFLRFLIKLQEDIVKIEEKTSEIKAKAAEGCTEHRKGLSLSVRVLSLS